MGEVLEIVKTLVSPAEKLIDIVKHGVGTLYQPRKIRKLADARSYEIDKIGEAMRNNSDIIITYDNGSVIANNPEFDDFVKRTQHRIACQELKKQYNIDSVVDKAYTELEFEADVPDIPIDDDWVSRLFDIIKDVSNDDMQYVWGKILAGEIKNPGSFSLRTLDTIRNISQQEASIFQRILPYIVSCGKETFVTSKKENLEKHGIYYSDIISLDECGLINSSGSLSLTLTLSKSDTIYLHNNTKVAIIKNLSEQSETIVVGVHTLTKCGRELYKILTNNSSDDTVSCFAKEISDNRKNIRVTIHKLNYFDSKMINYDEEILESYGDDLPISDCSAVICEENYYDQL